MMRFTVYGGTGRFGSTEFDVLSLFHMCYKVQQIAECRSEIDQACSGCHGIRKPFKDPKLCGFGGARALPASESDLGRSGLAHAPASPLHLPQQARLLVREAADRMDRPRTGI